MSLKWPQQTLKTALVWLKRQFKTQQLLKEVCCLGLDVCILSFDQINYCIKLCLHKVTQYGVCCLVKCFEGPCSDERGISATHVRETRRKDFTLWSRFSVWLWEIELIKNLNLSDYSEEVLPLSLINVIHFVSLLRRVKLWVKSCQEEHMLRDELGNVALGIMPGEAHIMRN